MFPAFLFGKALDMVIYALLLRREFIFLLGHLHCMLLSGRVGYRQSHYAVVVLANLRKPQYLSHHPTCAPSASNIALSGTKVLLFMITGGRSNYRTAVCFFKLKHILSLHKIVSCFLPISGCADA
jgi:hypothetical protein